MWWHDKRRFDAIEAALARLLEAEQRRSAEPKPATNEASALEALSRVMGGLAEAAATAQKSSAALLETLLERASKQVLRGTAQQMAAVSAEVRRGKAAVKKGWQIPAFVAQCEDCRAILGNRAPANTGDMVRHATERHAERLATAAASRDGVDDGLGG